MKLEASNPSDGGLQGSTVTVTIPDCIVWVEGQGQKVGGPWSFAHSHRIALCFKANQDKLFYLLPSLSQTRRERGVSALPC